MNAKTLYLVKLITLAVIAVVSIANLFLTIPMWLSLGLLIGAALLYTVALLLDRKNR